MPEGPEVKRCADLIRSKIDRKIIVDVISLSDMGKFKTIKGMENFKAVKMGDYRDSRVQKVFAIGKVIFILLSQEGARKPHGFISTLGMTGWWYPRIDQLDDQASNSSVYYQGKSVPTKTIIEKALLSARFKIVCSDGTELFYCDPRNFGNFNYADDIEIKNRTFSLGVDFLNFEYSDRVVSSHFTTLRKHDKHPIGEVLLKQDVIAGIGNIYRAEILYFSRIDPRRPIESLTDDHLKRVLRMAKLILNIGYDSQSKVTYPYSMFYEMFSPEDKQKFEQIRIERGLNAETALIARHAVYGWKEDVLGNPVITQEIGGRTMWWVPAIQM